MQMDAVWAGLAPLGLVLAVGSPYIGFLKKRYMGQYIREDGPQAHQSKAGTPTAGGVLILAGVLFGFICLSVLKQLAFPTVQVLWVLGITLVFGALGFVDDYLKISKKKNKGVSGYTKLAVQICSGLALGIWAMQQNPTGAISIFGLAELPLGWLYPAFAAFVITGASNAVNLTDGLDGLASGTTFMTFMAFSLILFAAGQPDLALVSQMLAGAALGFLMFNRHPARVFMGDTGSLALGGALGALAVTGRMELWLTLLASVYIIEALSVILQVISFKTTGKRIFRMSPLHHHFELGGWHETRVVYAFVTFQFLCCVLAVFLYNKA
ncbi:MAG TPA: phospho-N-acetylmuramoyl-pentapeptide-transferase [Oculatellaceae cyanobacterium]|jgi:phospho-N-acetylmuramoyl-pentapeptide-transferase